MTCEKGNTHRDNAQDYLSIGMLSMWHVVIPGCAFSLFDSPEWIQGFTKITSSYFKNQTQGCRLSFLWVYHSTENLEYAASKMIISECVNRGHLCYQSLRKSRCHAFQAAETLTVEYTAPRDILRRTFVWLTCNSPPYFSFLFSRFERLNPRTTQSYVLLLAVFHHSLTGWFISLGDNNTGCKSRILFEFWISHTILNYTDTYKHT